MDRAKPGMLRVLDADLKKEGTAQHALRASPPKIRTAEKHLVADVEHVRSAVLRATKIAGLLTAFASLGHNSHLAADGVTLANWYGTQCRTPSVPATHPSAPGSSSATTSTTGGRQGAPTGGP
jgi:hypothetical protein